MRGGGFGDDSIRKWRKSASTRSTRAARGARRPWQEWMVTHAYSRAALAKPPALMCANMCMAPALPSEHVLVGGSEASLHGQLAIEGERVGPRRAIGSDPVDHQPTVVAVLHETAVASQCFGLVSRDAMVESGVLPDIDLQTLVDRQPSQEMLENESPDAAVRRLRQDRSGDGLRDESAGATSSGFGSPLYS